MKSARDEFIHALERVIAGFDFILLLLALLGDGGDKCFCDLVGVALAYMSIASVVELLYNLHDVLQDFDGMDFGYISIRFLLY